MKEKKKLSLATQIFIALVLGIIAGMCLTKNADIATSYIKPFGTIFLNLIKWARSWRASSPCATSARSAPSA